MPSIKCPACGHRHFQPVPRCINCGTPFATSPMTMTSDPAVEQDMPGVQGETPGTPGNEILIDSSEPAPEPAKGAAPTTRVRRPARPAAERTTRRTGSSEKAAAAGVDPSRQLVVKQTEAVEAQDRKRWQKQTALQEYAPYETAVDIAMQDPFTSAPFGTVSIKEEQRVVSDPEHWKHDRLPLFFPRRRPELTGKVIHIESKEEIIDYPDMFAAIATIIVGLLWVIVDVQQEKDSDRVVITTLRVQTYEHGLKDARIRGNMRGADLSLGDEVSIWGRRRHGIVYVKRGYNHTTKGIVHTAAMGLMIPAILIILAFLIAFYFAPTWLPFVGHTFGNSFGLFFSFFKQHPIQVPTQKK